MAFLPPVRSSAARAALDLTGTDNAVASASAPNTHNLYLFLTFPGLTFEADDKHYH
jgi:hypothetical protein